MRRTWGVVLLVHASASAQVPESEPARSPVPAVSGYVQAQFTDGIDHDGDGEEAAQSFLLRRVRIRAKGEIHPGLGYTVMLDPSTPSNLLRDGFVSVGLVPRHEIRIGQQKTQFGYENPESSTRLLTINRARASDQLGRGPDLRDIGLGLLGAHPLPAALKVEYALTLVNGAGPNRLVDDTTRKSFWGRTGLRLERAVDVRAGFSYGNGDRLDLATTPDEPSDDFEVRFQRLGGDVEISTNWFFVAAEILAGSNENRATGATTEARGGYLSAYGRTSIGLGPLVRAEWLDPDLDAAGDLYRRITVGAFYDFIPTTARLVVNWERDLSDDTLDDAFLMFAQLLF